LRVMFASQDYVKELFEVCMFLETIYFWWWFLFVRHLDLSCWCDGGWAGKVGRRAGKVT
jgi:hypothetical protein